MNLECFSGREADAAARDYLHAEGLLDTFLAETRRSVGRIAPNFPDLARLHAIARARKAFTILEFGVGFSTVAMADALVKNKVIWSALAAKPKLRHEHQFQIHSVDTSAKWISETKAFTPAHLSKYVNFYQSECNAGTFNGRHCHFYREIPDVVPDLIYLDGPDPAAVQGQVQGVGWSNPDRVVISADLLGMEPWLLPGTCVVIDGRSANSRFLQNHFYRNWVTAWDRLGDVTIMELQEDPLGAINEAHLSYCLSNKEN